MRIGRFVTQEHRRHRDAVGVVHPDAGYRPEGVNICGVLVQAQPGRLDMVLAALALEGGVTVAHAAPDGRVVAVVEDTADEWAGQVITRLATLDGVAATALVYHHCEQGDLEEELDP